MILSNREPRIGYNTGHWDSRIVHIIKCLKDKLCCCWPPPSTATVVSDNNDNSMILFEI